MNRSIEALEVYDTTLRDGNQALESRLGVEEKLRLVSKLDEFGVDYIEGGWPESNPTDAVFFREARDLKLKNATLVAFGRTRKKGIRAEDDPVLLDLLTAGTSTITIFGKSSRFQVEEGLRTTLLENLNMIYDSVSFLKGQGRSVIYDAEHLFDGYRLDPEYAIDTLKAAISAGAKKIVLCDTNGGSVPELIAEVTRKVISRFPNISIGNHMHNDYGLATVNAIAGVLAGARQVQGVINGIGERAGNADLISVLINLSDHYGINGRVDLRQAFRLSQAVAQQTEIPVAPNYPITGANVFTHNAGTHAANHIRNPELQRGRLNPDSVGRETEIGFTDQGGGATVLAWAEKLGFTLRRNDPEFNLILNKMKEERIFGTAQIYLLFYDILEKGRSPFELIDGSSVLDTRGVKPIAKLKVRMEDDIYEQETQGEGLIDAFDLTLRAILAKKYPEIVNVELVPGSYRDNVSSKERGTAASVEVFLELSADGHTWSSRVKGRDKQRAGEDALVDGYKYYILKVLKTV